MLLQSTDLRLRTISSVPFPAKIMENEELWQAVYGKEWLTMMNINVHYGDSRGFKATLMSKSISGIGLTGRFIDGKNYKA